MESRLNDIANRNTNSDIIILNAKNGNIPIVTIDSLKKLFIVNLSSK